MYQNKKILVLGMARSGYEVAKLLSNYQNELIVTDGKPQDEKQVKELEQLHIPVIITEKQEDLLDDSFDVVIKNPGIKYTNPCVLKANELGIPVVNELEVSYSFLPNDVKIIGVTGSNGKTTTVTLIYEILRNSLSGVHLCGNIGYPLSSIVSKIKEGDTIVIEISDHQLCDMYRFKTNISVLTNISDAHADFHDSHERYVEMKKRIFNHHTKADFGILNFDNKESIEATKDIMTHKMYFSSTTRQMCYLEDGKIYYESRELISIDEIGLKGIHNYENVMASILVAKIFGIEDEKIIQVLKAFRGVEHRIEYVATIQNREIYNDSKSTNNVATITALKSFQKPIRLLLGGLDRNQNFGELYPYMTYVKKVYCFGETKEKIKQFCDEKNIKCEVFDQLKEGAVKAYQDSEEGEVILLSPACASWDQYQCFEDRGNEFKEIMKKLESDGSYESH